MAIELAPPGLVGILGNFSTLTVVAKCGEYDIPILTAWLSPVLAADLDWRRFVYDSEDESFQFVCDYLNGRRIVFSSSTVDSVLRIATDLGLSHLARGCIVGQ
jgi:hypothetical protein